MADFERLKTELKKTLHKMMMENTRLWLVRKLLKKKLATWDIYNFAIKQADLRTTIKSVDWQTVNSALRAKLKDIRHTLNEERRKKSRIERELKILLVSQGLKLKQIMLPWRILFRKEKKDRLEHFKNKIENLEKKQREKVERNQITKRSSQTIPPKFLIEYDGLRIFSPSDAFPKKEAPLGPYIGSSSIPLTEGKRRILSRDPKYSLRGEVEATDFRTEVDKNECKEKI